MKNGMQLITGFKNTRFEKSADNLEAELESFTQTEGRNDALKSTQIPETGFKTKVFEYVRHASALCHVASLLLICFQTSERNREKAGNKCLSDYR